jgi:hypothetical protein
MWPTYREKGHVAHDPSWQNGVFLLIYFSQRRGTTNGFLKVEKHFGFEKTSSGVQIRLVGFFSAIAAESSTIFMESSCSQYVLNCTTI